jgi:hypothetical protein
LAAHNVEPDNVAVPDWVVPRNGDSAAITELLLRGADGAVQNNRG